MNLATQDIDLLRPIASRLDQGQHKIECPLCQRTRKKNRQDKPLSMLIGPESAAFFCHHCGMKGGFDLVNKSVYRRSTVTPMRPSIEVPEQTSVSQAVEYLATRGISEEIARKHTISGEWSFGDGRRLAIGWQYLMGEDVVAIKWRSADKDKKFSQHGVCDMFWNLENVDVEKPLIVCEGEIDALTWLMVNPDASIVSVPNGAPATVGNNDRKFNYLWSARDILQEVPQIIFSGDLDAPGDALIEEISRRVGKGRCYRIDLASYKDANEALCAEGTEWLQERLDVAQPLPLRGLYDPGHYLDKFHDLYTDGRPQGVSTGFKTLDPFVKLAPGLYTITGYPGDGKSDFVDALVLNASRPVEEGGPGWNTVFCSFEKPPQHHMIQLAQKLTNRNFFEGQTQRMTPEERDRAADYLQEHFLFLDYMDGGPADLDGILDFMASAILRIGAKIAVIDPYNFIEQKVNPNQLETDVISDMLTRCQQFCRQHEVALMFVAHPAKPADKSQRVVGGLDVAKSMAWYAKSDFGITIARDSETRQPEVHIWKCRWSWLGKQGSVPLEYDLVSGSWSEPGGEGYDWEF